MNETDAVIAPLREAKASTCAALLGVSTRQVRKLAETGDLPRIRHGRYDLVTCIQTLANAGDTLDFMEQKARLTKLQADKADLDLQARRGELAPIEEVHRQWDELLSWLRARALGMPSKLTPAVMGATQDFATVKTVIDAGVREWLTEMSEYTASEG